MGAVVDYQYYIAVYEGNEADGASFPALCARASDIVGAMTRWTDPEKLCGFQREMYMKAVCAQVDFFAVNGAEIAAAGTGAGFTVGKVSVQAGAKEDGAGKMSASVSPLAQMYLEQSGLMAPQVTTGIDMPFAGWY